MSGNTPVASAVADTDGIVSFNLDNLTETTSYTVVPSASDVTFTENYPTVTVTVTYNNKNLKYTADAYEADYVSGYTLTAYNCSNTEGETLLYTTDPELKYDEDGHQCLEFEVTNYATQADATVDLECDYSDSTKYAKMEVKEYDDDGTTKYKIHGYDKTRMNQTYWNYGIRVGNWMWNTYELSEIKNNSLNNTGFTIEQLKTFLKNDIKVSIEYTYSATAGFWGINTNISPCAGFNLWENNAISKAYEQNLNDSREYTTTICINDVWQYVENQSNNTIDSIDDIDRFVIQFGATDLKLHTLKYIVEAPSN